ncbi:hypothetical protein AAY473_025992, partial [Plecturocebus cupreus]
MRVWWARVVLENATFGRKGLGNMEKAHLYKIYKNQLGMVVLACGPSYLETEAKGSPKPQDVKST